MHTSKILYIACDANTTHRTIQQPLQRQCPCVVHVALCYSSSTSIAVHSSLNVKASTHDKHCIALNPLEVNFLSSSRSKMVYGRIAVIFVRSVAFPWVLVIMITIGVSPLQLCMSTSSKPCLEQKAKARDQYDYQHAKQPEKRLLKSFYM